MRLGSEVVRAAREWVGTPWRHQGRTRGVGVDCVGVAVGVARELALLPPSWDYTAYAREPRGDALQQALEAECTRLLLRKPGCLLLIRVGRQGRHLAIYAGHNWDSRSHTLIHASPRHRKVVEHGLTETWQRAVIAAYGLPGVVYG